MRASPRSLPSLDPSDQRGGSAQMQLDVQRTNAPSFPTSSPLEGPGLPHAQSRSCEVCQTPSPLPRPVLSSELSPQTVHPPRRLHHHLVRDLLTWVCVSRCRTWTPAPFPPMPSDLGIECPGPSLAPLLRTFPGVSGPLAPLSGSPPLLPVFEIGRASCRERV